MKLVKIITTVAAIHVCLIGILLMQSGCKTIDHVKEVATRQTIRSQSDFDVHLVALHPQYNGGFDVSNRDFDVDQAVVMDHSQQANEFNKRQTPTRPAWSMDAHREKFATRHQTPANAQARLMPSDTVRDENASNLSEYTVKLGDSLWLIAKRHGVTLDELLDVNNIRRDSILRVGQVLQIPHTTYEKPVAYSSSNKPKARGGKYIIKKGDTLSTIASYFGVSVQAIKQANGMKNDTIYQGKSIVIPGVDDSKTASAKVAKTTHEAVSKNMESDGESYTVRNGDTLSEIAKSFNVSVAELMTWNSISDAKRLRVGQKLVIHSDKLLDDDFFFEESDFDDLDELFSETTVVEETIEEHAYSEDFADDSLFDLSEEIPIVSVHGNN